MEDVPKLVDPKVKGFLKGALLYSHSIKKEYTIRQTYLNHLALVHDEDLRESSGMHLVHY